jgi:hypothetical protein
VTGDEARFKGLALRGREGRQRGDSGETGGRCAIVSHSHLAPFSRTGKMPVPQRVDFLVGWASCPPVKGLLTMVPDIRASEIVTFEVVARFDSHF